MKNIFSWPLLVKHLVALILYHHSAFGIFNVDEHCPLAKSAWNFVSFYGETCIALVFHCQKIINKKQEKEIWIQIVSTLKFKTFIHFRSVFMMWFIRRWSSIQPTFDGKFMDFSDFHLFILFFIFSLVDFFNLKTLNLMVSLHGWANRYKLPKWSSSFERIIFGIIAKKKKISRQSVQCSALLILLLSDAWTKFYFKFNMKCLFK